MASSSLSTPCVISIALQRPPQNAQFRTLRFSPLNTTNSPLKFSFTRSVSELTPLMGAKLPTATAPSRQPFAVFAAKKGGYKIKTHKASAKRFRVSGTGKIMRRRSGKQHLLGKKNTKRRLRLSKMVQVDRSDYDNVIRALPYLKVNRAN